MLTPDFLFWISPRSFRLSLIWSCTFKPLIDFVKQVMERKKDKRDNCLSGETYREWNLCLFCVFCFPLFCFVFLCLSALFLYIHHPGHPVVSCWSQVCKCHISLFPDLPSHNISPCDRQVPLIFLLFYPNLPLWKMMQD